jgi:hypothetical protein
MSLRLDWCSYDAAKYAVENWHYSKRMPSCKMVKVGVWEQERFIGVVLFGYGANHNHGKSFGLKQTHVCELLRVALTKHETPVTRIVSIAIKMLRKLCPGLRLIVSYADSEQGHHGGIYAGGNWLYVGLFEAGEKGTPHWKICGRIMHGRTVGQRWEQNLEWIRAHVDPYAEKVYPKGKHKYFYPLDAQMKNVLQTLAQEYPKRATSIDGDVSRIQREQGSSSLTVALKIDEVNT